MNPAKLFIEHNKSLMKSASSNTLGEYNITVCDVNSKEGRELYRKLKNTPDKYRVLSEHDHVSFKSNSVMVVIRYLIIDQKASSQLD
jgi:hypothetical protein